MKVAKIIDCYTVAITKTDAPYLGRGDILTIGSQEIIDPETGESLGRLPQLQVKVCEVYDKFVIAETYRYACTDPLVTVNIGDPVCHHPQPAF